MNKDVRLKLLLLPLKHNVDNPFLGNRTGNIGVL